MTLFWGYCGVPWLGSRVSIATQNIR